MDTMKTFITSHVKSYFVHDFAGINCSGACGSFVTSAVMTSIRHIQYHADICQHFVVDTTIACDIFACFFPRNPLLKLISHL